MNKDMSKDMDKDMKKDMEKEYKELMREDVPDLWGRIEAGLEPKDTAADKKKLWKKYGSWGMAVAAACLCLAVIVPVMLNRGLIFSGEREYLYNYAAPIYSDDEQNAWSGGAAVGDDGAAYDIQYEASSAEENNRICLIRGVVTDISEEQDRTAYAVEIVESDNEDFSAGDTVVLYDFDFIREEIMIGETYRFSAFILADSEDSTEYWIYEAKQE